MDLFGEIGVLVMLVLATGHTRNANSDGVDTLGDAVIILALLSFPSTGDSVDDESVLGITVALTVEELSGGVSSSNNGGGS